MKVGVNKVIIQGDVVKEPVVTVTPNGKTIVNFLIPTKEIWRDETKTSGWAEKTEWHRIVFFNKTAEVVASLVNDGRLAKGAVLYVEGKNVTRSFKKAGEEKESWVTEVVCEEFQVIVAANKQVKQAAKLAQQQQGPIVKVPDLEGFDHTEIPF